MKPGITECVRCENFFTCKGRPEGIERCINYSERNNLKTKTGKDNLSEESAHGRNN